MLSLAQQRRNAAATRTLALMLVGLAGVALVNGVVAEFPGSTPLGNGTMFALHVLVGTLASFAAILVWTGERRAEPVAIVSVALACVLTVVTLVNGFWFSAPVLGVAVLLTIIVLTRRLTMLDEERHGAPIASTWV